MKVTLTMSKVSGNRYFALFLIALLIGLSFLPWWPSCDGLFEITFFQLAILLLVLVLFSFGRPPRIRLIPLVGSLTRAPPLNV